MKRNNINWDVLLIWMFILGVTFTIWNYIYELVLRIFT